MFQTPKGGLLFLELSIVVAFTCVKNEQENGVIYTNFIGNIWIERAQCVTSSEYHVVFDIN